MFDRRTKNAIIFKDTEQMYQNDEKLKVTIEKSLMNQKLILSGDVVEYKVTENRVGKVIVSGKRTLEASERYAKQGKRVCVLNFASATNPENLRSGNGKRSRSFDSWCIRMWCFL